jgi:uncharacterized protein YggT (Ycf19 family)
MFWANVAPVNLLLYAIKLLRVPVLADAVFTFAFKPDQFPRSLTKPLLDPIYAPWRETVGRVTGSLDFSPLVALAILYVAQVWIERRRAVSGAD